MINDNAKKFEILIGGFGEGGIMMLGAGGPALLF